MVDDYSKFILDDDDDDDENDTLRDDGLLDTQWISDFENKMLFNEYELFLKSDITHVSFRFIYLDRVKKSIEFIVPMVELYPLQKKNQITQTEIFKIIYRHQHICNDAKKKYYNFHSLILYDFQLEDDNVVRSVAEYISSSNSNIDFGRIIEYTNILSFETIYFRPLITMFHDLIGFTVILYED